MEIKQLGSNQTLLIMTDGSEVLFSYETPVAGRTNKELPGHTGGYFKTDKKWSITTSKHINKYLEGVNATIVDQNSINNLVK